MNSQFPYIWKLSDGYPANGIQEHGKKVFGTFICGGGSTMGYKLAGYVHLGGVEIDEKVAAAYKANHNPKYLFIEDIRCFNQRKDIPEELFNLDLLDGSPPCSSFSMAGKREEDWVKKKQFREGQEYQRLDDLVFEYVKTIGVLKPKVAVLENVKGLIQGNAKAYAREIIRKFSDCGYNVQLFLLNAASMGVPQKRERVFFIGLRNDIDLPKLNLSFNCEPIRFKEVHDQARKFPDIYYKFSELESKYWYETKEGDAVGKFNSTSKKVPWNEVSNTLTAGGAHGLCHPLECRPCSKNELILISSFPLDYDFKKIKPIYLMGMSVPPVMTAQVANEIYKQWLSNI